LYQALSGALMSTYPKVRQAALKSCVLQQTSDSVSSKPATCAL